MYDLADNLNLYESVDELANHIDRGNEIQFIHNNKAYWIFSKPEIVLFRMAIPGHVEESEAVFPTIGEFLNAEIDGETVRNLATEIIITHTLFH